MRRNLQQVGVAFFSLDLAEDVLPFADGSFDLVLCHDLIEYPPGLRHRLLEIRRVLADEGCAFIGFPNGASLRNRVSKLFGKNPLYSARAWYFEDVYRGYIYEPTWEDIPLIFEESRLQVSQILCHKDIYEPSGREPIAKRLVKRLLRVLTTNRELTQGFIVKAARALAAERVPTSGSPGQSAHALDAARLGD